MPRVLDQEHGFRRGLVLGLTMAEIVILVIFVLLLVLGALLAQKAREAEVLRASNAELQLAKSELDRIAATIGDDPSALAKELSRAGEVRSRLEATEKEVARLKELESAIEAVRPTGAATKPIPEEFRELVLIRDAIVAAGVAPTPEAVQRSLAEAEESKDIRDRLTSAESEAARLSEVEKILNAARPADAAERATSEIVRELVLIREEIAKAGISPTPGAVQRTLAEGDAAKRALEGFGGKDTAALVIENARMGREVDTLKGQMANLRRQAQSAGRGLDHPPCWASPDGRPEYIFDVALTDAGLVIRDRPLPHRAADRVELPLDGIAFEVAPLIWTAGSMS